MTVEAGSSKHESAHRPAGGRALCNDGDERVARALDPRVHHLADLRNAAHARTSTTSQTGLCELSMG
jgi:hypothetical protein